MKNKIVAVGLCFTLFLISCSEKTAVMSDDLIGENQTYYSDSFLPMSVGNYWRIDDGNYTSITDTIRIAGELFYKFESLVGWDAMSLQYLRLDENNNLIEKSPTNPDRYYLHAKFNSAAGTKFFTLNDQSVNDYEVTLKSTNHDSIEFEFKMIYHPNLAGEKHSVAYKKGLGFTGNWKEVKIDHAIYRFE